MKLSDFSLKPDEHMRWIYDPSHPDYNSLKAKDLRNRRWNAIKIAPKWLREIAESNDAVQNHTLRCNRLSTNRKRGVTE